MPLDPAAALAAHVANARFADLPATTLEATKQDFHDTLGCALGGSGAPGIAELLKLYRSWGGAGEAGLMLVGGRLPAPQAAFIHGAMAHALDYDDTYDKGGSIHPGASVLGAALAMADYLGGVSGQDLILAAALGLDVSCRIARAATVDRGWHRTSAIGVFGAAMVAGKLLGLSAEHLHQALGIALSSAAGSRQCILDGALTKRFQAGQAASAGIVAALLAADGFTGAREVFAGRFGFYELYQPGGFDLSLLTKDLGRKWFGEEVSFKPYPCGRPLHAAIDAAIEVHETLGLTPDTPIADVTVSAPSNIISGYFEGAPQKRRPTQIVEAQFAFPFLVATGLLKGRVGIDEVAHFDDPRILAVSDRVAGVPAEGAVAVTVNLADGRTARHAVTVARGAPENPLTAGQRAAKFRDCAVHAMRPIPDATLEKLLYTLGSLEGEPDARVILRHLE
ncbi:MmgE/PrpD family protein [Acidisphaera sp. S103]|uniref:MmgE/PrpD family protein n=1 Tax=Acidisphaera sp. S103 TaxID=1747223 RepID=UPI00131CBEE7|nr:MmgE/PrpD family protein [Acidisphaera sp. S103]